MQAHADNALIRRLTGSWKQRAAVMRQDGGGRTFDPSIPDFPSHLVPFWNHPKFALLPCEKQHLCLSYAWQAYNQRTITAENYIAIPALMSISKWIPYQSDFAVHEALQQILIDEHYHTLLHLRASNNAFVERELELIDFPLSVTYRSLLEQQRTVAENWQKDLLELIYAVVAEVSVNALLRLISEARDIQPAHQMVAHLHDRDEHAHSRLLVEITKSVFLGLTPSQKKFFVQYLPMALEAFVAHDYSSWGKILRRICYANADEIIEDCENEPNHAHLVRDYSGIHTLVEQLGIANELEFDFDA